MSNTKAALRQRLLPLRNAAFPAQLDINMLKSYDKFISAKTVFCYVSAKGEVDTHSLVNQLLQEKSVVVPYCIDKCGNMICVKINSSDDLTEGLFGIPEPKNPIEFPKDEIDFVLVPGIAFDKEGYRLGYGKGYYDRFLSDISPFKLGVCERKFFLDTLPHDKYDIKMDSVLIT